MNNPLTRLLPYLPTTLAATLLTTMHPGPSHDIVDGVVLFTDISGFTALTESLGQRGSAGTEELTRLLNRYFSRMIAILEAHGGSVVKFSGDALTTLFLTNDEPLGYTVRRAHQAATAIQQTMNEFRHIETSVGAITLGTKITIGSGSVYIFRVGGIFKRWEYLIAGAPLRQVAEVSDSMVRGDSRLSAEAAQIIHPMPLDPRPLPALPEPTTITAELVELLRSYIPAAVRNWLDSDLADWIAVIRAMSVIFVKVVGLNYEATDALERVQTFFAEVQHATYRYEGSINKVMVDDKGTVLLILFGAPPFAHTDDPLRAIQCAFDLQEVAGSLSIYMHIGIATGSVFAGPVGSETRREYTAMGDTVNLGARLMNEAMRGQICCNLATMRATAHAIAFEDLGRVKLKGKHESVSIYRPTAQRPPSERITAQSDVIHRSHEQAQIDYALDTALQGNCRVIVVSGETGMGKSHLLRRLTTIAGKRGVACFSDTASSQHQYTPFHVWRTFLIDYFALDDGIDRGSQQAIVTATIARSAPSLLERLPLLNEVLALDLAENDLTLTLDASSRRSSCVELIVELVRIRAKQHPLVLQIDDIHWSDSLSREVLLELVHTLSIANLPVLVALGVSQLEGRGQTAEIAEIMKLPFTDVISLKRLGETDIIALVATSLEVLADAIPQTVKDLILTRADGNPLFAKALALTLRDRGSLRIELNTSTNERYVVVIDDTHTLATALPATVRGAILARFDRLETEDQRLLGVSGVIGDEFSLLEIHAALAPRVIHEHDIQRFVTRCTKSEFIEPLPSSSGDRYRFKNALTRDTIYENLPFERRRELHATIAAWHERQRDQTPRYGAHAVIGYHWEQAEVVDRALIAWEQAGEYALTISALSEAQNALRKALALLVAAPADSRIDRFRESRLRRQLGNALWQSDHLDTALTELYRSLQLARDSNNRTDEIESLTALGRVLMDRNEIQTAREMFEQAVQLADQRPTHTILRYLGVIARRKGNRTTAIDYCRQALIQAQIANDEIALASILIELGNVYRDDEQLDQAITQYQQGLQHAEHVGHRLMMSVAIGNLGEVATQRGVLHEAQGYLERSIQLSRDIGDRAGVNVGINNLGELQLKLERLADAANSFYQGVMLALERRNDEDLLYAIHGVSQLWIERRWIERAVVLVGLVLNHPVTPPDLHDQAVEVRRRCIELLPPDVMITLIDNGAQSDLHRVAHNILDDLAILAGKTGSV